jgi:hypothetical protein
MTEPVALMSCMRNEGIHVVEWLAYHRIIGFGPILICTNDCTDGTDRLLDALAAAGAVQHLPNPLGRDQAPQDEGIRRVMARLSGGPVDWLAHLDSDEFLNIAPGAAPVQDIIARAGDAHAIALPWLNFGDNGHGAWPGETLPAFTRCEAAIDPDLVKFKSIFRLSAFHHASEHMPTDPKIEDPRAVNSGGKALSPGPLLGPPRARYRPVDVAMRGGAVVNHYATRSTDVFLMKNDRGFGTGKPFGKYHLNSAWHRRINRNDREDRTILRRWDEVAAEISRLRALPGVAAAEAACLTWFQTTRQRLLVPDTIRRWTKALSDESP